MTLKIDDIESKLGLNIRELQANEVLFFTGAGISAASPIDFPLGDELHKLVLKQYTNLKLSTRERLTSRFTFEIDYSYAESYTVGFIRD